MIEKQYNENINSEIKENKKSFDFIKIGFSIDTREAQNKFMKERRENVEGAKNLTFNQWLDIKKFEAAKFYVENCCFFKT